ncbi:hypothetical protein [Sagittula salina]|uniref:Uncharacterized protein n=1 Tax=Sagittula salina TaxID=2820268 RepID=A0A940MN71_9RHOB|nr:hypothetical protein [Sagittula salina]MBP0484990.1 hypothetical protein [Sagittula salina]
MGEKELQTGSYVIKTDSREVTVQQTMLVILEINSALAEATGIDLTGAVSAMNDAKTIEKVTRELGLAGRGYIKQVNGKAYFILKGNPGLRPTLQGTRYLATNPKITQLIVSPKTMAAGAAKATGIAIIAYCALHVVEYVLADEDRSLARLLGTVGADVIKFGVAAAAGWLAGAIVGSATTVVAGPLIAAFVVGVTVGIVLDRVDRAYGLTELLVRGIEQVGDGLMAPFRYLGRQIAQWEEYLKNQAINNATRYR